MTSLDDLRDEFMRTGFGLRDAAEHPMQQFATWFQQAQAAGLFQPRAAALATVNALGRPTARMVVLAGLVERGIDFLTDERSPKADDLHRLPWAALVVHWAELERQVRLEGPVQPLTPGEADAYFGRRAREAQLSAWASRQSEVIAGRELLEERLLDLLTEQAGRPLTRPPYYGGFRLKPALAEFWQGRSDRLSDRVRYRQAEDESWIIELLSP